MTRCTKCNPDPDVLCEHEQLAVDNAIASARLEGVELSQDWIDRIRDLACGRVTYEELVQEVKDRYRDSSPESDSDA